MARRKPKPLSVGALVRYAPPGYTQWVIEHGTLWLVVKVHPSDGIWDCHCTSLASGEASGFLWHELEKVDG